MQRADGSTEERAFAVMAGIGLDAKMVANSNEDLKRRVGWVAYIDAIAKAVRDTDRLKVRFRIDDGPIRAMSAHTVLVGNCGLLPGNILLLPEATLDDGRLDIVALRSRGLLRLARGVGQDRVGERGAAAQHVRPQDRRDDARDPHDELPHGVALHVQLEREEEFELDGDEFGRVVGFSTTTDPGAIRVRVAAPADAA